MGGFTARVLAVAVTAALAGTSAVRAGEFSAARLGDDLTPVGAEKAGDDKLGIPAWSGGLGAAAPAPVHYVDPFAADQPIGLVSAADGERWAAWLTPGLQARLLSDPDLRLPVYPTHRSAADSDAFYAATRENALHAALHEAMPDGTPNGIPFPVPDNGLQVIWNHLLRERSPSGEHTLLQSIVQPDGHVLTERLVQRYAHFSVELQKKHPEQTPLANLLELVLAPKGLAGTVMMLRASYNAAPKIWTRDAMAVWLTKVTDAAPGTTVPGAVGLLDVDQIDGFLGPPGQYDWELIGKEPRIVPYNAYRLDRNDLAAGLLPRHLDQRMLRYEVHRTWHVRGTCHGATTCHYNRRDYWLDEDSWQILLGDLYVADRLVMVQEEHPLMAPDRKHPITVLEAVYEPGSGRYLVRGVDHTGTQEEKSEVDSSEFFRPLSARLWAVRELDARSGH